MALNSSGPISLGGTTAGQSIALENGGSGTSTISLNDTAVRNLAGVPSGTIIMPTNFWGKSNAAYGFVGVIGGFATASPPNNYIELAGTGLDSSGNFYVASRVYSGNVGGAQGYGAYLAKFNSVGTLQWQRKARVTGTTNSQEGNGRIYIDGSSNVYVAWGNGGGGIGQTLIKYNSSGIIQWQKQFNYGGGNYQIVYGMVADSSGNLYVTGGVYAGYSSRGIILKYNSSGTLLVAAELSSASSSRFSTGIGIDSSGNLYVNYLNGSSSSPVTALVKVNSSLVSILRNYGSTSNFYTPNQGSSQITYTNGDTYLGHFNANTNQNVVNKFNSSGVWQWGITYSSGVNYQAPMVTVDEDGNVYAVCRATGISGIFSQLIIKLNSSGTVQWQRNLAYAGNRMFTFGGFTASTANGILIGGCFGYDSTAGFVTKLPVDGSKTGTYTVSGYSVEYSVSSVSISSFTLSNSQAANTGLTNNIAGYNESISLTWTESADTSTTTFTTI